MRSVGKLIRACSGSREQASSEKKIKTHKDSNEFMFKVRCFDTVKIHKAGEYLIRGCVELSEGVEGLFQSKEWCNASNNSTVDRKWMAASGVVKVDIRKLIPVRLWTFEDDVKLQKGLVIGELSTFPGKRESDSVDTYRMNQLSNHPTDLEARWEILQSQFNAQLCDLRSEERQILVPLLKEYADIFSVDKNDIGLTDVVKHEIDTGMEKPIVCPYRRVPMALEDKVEKMIHELADKGIIQPSESAWNAPLVIVPKKNGDIRLTVDYRKLNSITKRPIFPIPDTRHLLDALHGSAYFTTLDLSSGYYNVPMAEKDIEKTAFTTRSNHWEFVRMPMGLSTSPSTFQKLMHKVFDKENWHQCLIYLDDILIFSKDLQEQVERLRTIFERVRHAGLKLSPGKCEFLKNEVSYLGYSISRQGTHTDKRKIEKITNWSRPVTAEDLRSWLGLCGYYRQFIQNYSRLAAPLENMCKKIWNNKTKRCKTGIEWDDVCTDAFNKLKIALTTAPVLAYPTMDDKFILDCDASHECMGSVLSQIQNGKERVIAYGSKKFSQSERQYCITRKELLAVHHFVHHFKHYLLGRAFIVRTDHRALTWMLNWKNPNTSQYCRWRQELEVFDMEVQYRRGEEHANADALSRLPQCHQCELRHANPKNRAKVKHVEKGEHELFCRNIVSFEEQLNQENDDDLAQIIKLMKSKRMTEKEPNELKQCGIEGIHLWRMRSKLRFRGDMLYLIDSDDNYKLLIPSDIRKRIIKLTHENFAHTGIKKTLKLLSEKYYWLNMELDVKMVISMCKSCLKRKTDGARKYVGESLQSCYPFQKISLDVTGPLPRGKCGESYLLGIIDNFSRFATLVPLRKATGVEIAHALYKEWITKFGVPDAIHSDRGTEFQNEVVRELCEIFGVQRTKSSPYYPQGNSIIERLFRTVKDMIFTTTAATNKDWTTVIPTIEMALRCTEHSSLKFTPYEVVFGRKMATPLNNGLELKNKTNSCEYIISLQNQLKNIYRKIRESTKQESNNQNEYISKQFQIGDMVMAKIFPLMRGIDKARYEGPYEIIGQRGKWCYVLRHTKSSKVIERNQNHLKKCRIEEDSRENITSIESCTKGIRNERSIQEVVNMQVQNSRYPKRNRRRTEKYGYS